MQFAENFRTNWEEEHCFIWTMSGSIKLEQPRTEFRNPSPELAPNVFHLFGPHKNYLGGKSFPDDEEVETEVR
jgi:hypothetical protein